MIDRCSDDIMVNTNINISMTKNMIYQFTYYAWVPPSYWIVTIILGVLIIIMDMKLIKYIKNWI